MSKFLFLTAIICLTAIIPSTDILSLRSQPLAAGNGEVRQQKLAGARAEIERLIREGGADTVSVAVEDLESGERLLVNERVVLHAASMMKVPVMMSFYELASRSEIKLKEPLAIANSFKSIVDGSEYRLSPDDDSDPELYRRIGEKAEFEDLIERMITRSSNLATNLVIERIGPERVMEMVRRLGAKDLMVRRGVEDSKAFQKGLNNTVTAFDLMVLFSAIARKEFLGPEMSERMIGVLLKQEFKDAIPAGLPAGTPVAHKTGWITRIKHDGGIVMPPGRKPYILVVLTRGIADEKRANQLIAAISRTVHRALTEKM